MIQVILDTNVWSEIGRRDSRERLEQLAVARGWRIMTPPAVLLEAVMTPDPKVRHDIIEALSSPLWVRLRTEADQEAAEVVAETKRLRPMWLRKIPDTGRPAHFRLLWQKRVWREA